MRKSGFCSDDFSYVLGFRDQHREIYGQTIMEADGDGNQLPQLIASSPARPTDPISSPTPWTVLQAASMKVDEIIKIAKI